jgi:hypothetical protein
MFLVIIVLVQGGQVVFRHNASRIQMGFLIGSAAMLSELFFLLMCFFFVLGAEANTNGYGNQLN